MSFALEIHRHIPDLQMRAIQVQNRLLKYGPKFIYISFGSWQIRVST